MSMGRNATEGASRERLWLGDRASLVDFIKRQAYCLVNGIHRAYKPTLSIPGSKLGSFESGLTTLQPTNQGDRNGLQTYHTDC